MSEARTGRGRQAARDSEERLEVLRLLQAGEITPEEAAQLLDALDRSEPGESGGATVRGEAGFSGSGRRGASFRLRVSDSTTGRANVNLSLPLGLVGAGLAVARRFAPQSVPDPGAIDSALAEGLRGKILDVDDDGQRVEIWVE